MSPPAVRVNTFVPMKEMSFDLASKIFIIFELICGINRLSVFGRMKPICFAISLAFSLSINILVIYLTNIRVAKGLGKLATMIKLWQYCMCAILGFAFRKRLRNFFFELIKFDKETGFLKNKGILKNTAHIFLTFGFVIIFLIFLKPSHIFKHPTIEIIVILLINVVELHFFGHLLSLLIPRLRFLNRLMRQSFRNRSSIRTVQQELLVANETNHLPIDVKKMMDYYHRIIIAFDTLYDAIKWQMIIILVTSFITSLTVSYRVILRYIRNEYSLVQLLLEIILAASDMFPLFAPCRVVDAMHGEVRCIKQLLSLKLYENKIEKSNRAVAQAFLALMEARNLSFSLLRIFDIDVSFPFKFLALLVTYLIILLQFEKVLNLDRPTV